jgi:hypothetical protein
MKWMISQKGGSSDKLNIQLSKAGREAFKEGFEDEIGPHLQKAGTKWMVFLKGGSFDSRT